MAAAERPRVVVVGGGFGGLSFVRALRRAPVRITLVDRRNFHLFQPLLYEVATATLSPPDVTSTLRSMFRKQENVQVRMGEVVEVDPESRELRLDDGRPLGYDYLLVATGLRNEYFGHPEWEAFAPGLKTIEDALEIRRRFLAAFEAAEWEADPEARRKLLTFVIIGAGPTGVELAGAMSEVVREVLPRDFRSFDPSTARIVLVDAADRVFPTFPPELSAAAEEELRARGVEVRTGAKVTDIGPEGVTLEGDFIECRNVFWGAGVAATPLAERLGVPTDKIGRVMVEPDCSAPGRPEVFVVGDVAHLEKDGRVVTGVASAAIQMGRHAARMVQADLAGKPREPFRFREKGSVATIGRAAGVSEAGGVRVAGTLAWMAHTAIHLFYLSTLRDRAVVLLEWARSWLLDKRDARLITSGWKPQGGRPGERRPSDDTTPPGS